MPAVQPYELDDPFVESLASFLERVPMSNGQTTAGLAPPITTHLSQAILNWLSGLVWQDDQWVDRAVWESTPDLGDVEIEEIADGAVVKMTQRSTGLSALGETHDQAWDELRRKANA